MKRPAKLSHLALSRRALRTAATELQFSIQLETTRPAQRSLMRLRLDWIQNEARELTKLLARRGGA